MMKVLLFLLGLCHCNAPSDIVKKDNVTVNKSKANSIFFGLGFGPVSSGEEKPVDGEIYFAAMGKMLEILTETGNEAIFEMITQTPTNSQDDTAKTKEEMEKQSRMEEEIRKCMLKAMKALHKLVFESSDGLDRVIQQNSPNASQISDNPVELVAMEMMKDFLGKDRVSGFVLFLKDGRYHDILLTAEKLAKEYPILGHEFMVPVWEFLGSSTKVKCNLATYMLSVLFCVRMKIVPYVLRQQSSVSGQTM